MKDLVALVADNTMRAALENILQRASSLGIRPLSTDLYSHPRHDPGVLKESAAFLAPLREQYSNALVMFDREGCGQEDNSAKELQDTVQVQLDRVGWADHSSVIVLDPELEIWVWSDSPHVSRILGVDRPELDQLLTQYRIPGNVKPSRPKELMEKVLRHSHIPRSASLYADLARFVGIERCIDPAFLRLRSCLTQWFSSSR